MQTKASFRDKLGDVHTRIMRKNYEPVPQWWFYTILVIVIGLAFLTCEGFNKQLQLPYWGSDLGRRLGYDLHSPHWSHHSHHQPATGSECHQRADHRIHVPGKATGQSGIQDIWLHKHVPSNHVSVRLQAGTLQEDNTSKIHVHRSASGDYNRVVSILRDSVVATRVSILHLPTDKTCPGKPLDVPGGRGILQRLNNLGRCRTNARAWQTRPLPGHEQLFPDRSPRPGPTF
ncbi:unnamed protein product [Rhodiola kirilowii]